MAPRRTRAVVALAAVGLLALAASAAPAAAKSGDKDSEPGKLKTATASATSATVGVVTATATCPGKSKVVGGGLLLQAPVGGAADLLNPIESRRVSKKAWQVTAYRVDGGGAGPAMTATAEAYCRTGLGKLTEKAVGETVLGAAATASPVATCPLGRTAVSGGFSITPPVTPNSFHVLLYENLMAGRVGWTMRAVQVTAPPRTETYTSYAYCQQKGEKAPKVVTGSAAFPTPPPIAAAADTAPCAGKRDAFAGGFQFPNSFGFGPVLLTESRHNGKGWHIAATRFSGSAPATITALGYCS